VSSHTICVVMGVPVSSGVSASISFKALGYSCCVMVCERMLAVRSEAELHTGCCGVTAVGLSAAVMHQGS
jgi:hypothetical protein